MDQSWGKSQGRAGSREERGRIKVFNWPRAPFPWGFDAPKISSLPDSQGP